MRKFVVIAVFSILCLSGVPAFGAIKLDKIVVTPSRTFSLSEKSGRSVAVIDKELTEYSAHDAIPDIIGELGGIDIRRRGVEGVQSDVNIRGANFEENSVLIDGIKINDPQTGHFTMDLPFTLMDVDRVEILKGPASALYGPNSFGGTINIITKKTAEKKLILIAEGGSFDYVSGGVSLAYPLGPVNNRFSFEERRSSGYMEDTEFNIISLADKASIDTFLGVYDFLFGYQKKDFGAANFYSNLYPNEEEHTDTRFFNISGEAESGSLKVSPKLFLRRHWDKFMLDRNRPGWQTNYSTTYTYGGELGFVLENDILDAAYGFELARDTIDSTNMQTHSRTRDGVYVEISPHIHEKLDLKLSFREDYSTDFGWEYAPLASGALELTKGLSARFAIGRSYRIPTFTDLYYNDAANRGDPRLRPETSWSYEAGLDASAHAVNMGATYFYRDARDPIDWVRQNARNPWQAANIGSSVTNGVELYLELAPKQIYEDFPVDKFFAKYTALDTYAKHDYLSKYALDYLKQEISCGFEWEVLGFRNSWVLNYKKRVGESGYAVCDMKLTKDIIRKKNLTFQGFLTISNLSDTRYSEQSGVRMPGRWIRSGARVEL